MKKNFVKHSSVESREKGAISILAIFETTIFVVLTWSIAYYYNNYTFLYLSILAVPFFLLKTQRSIDKAIDLFFRVKDINIMLLLIKFSISILISIVIGYIYYTQVINNYDGWQYFLLIIVLIILVLITILVLLILFEGMTMAMLVMNLAELSVIVAVISAIALTIGLLLRSVISKIIATTYCALLYPKEAILAIPKNYLEQIAINDIFYTPELLPNIYKKNPFFQLSGFVKEQLSSVVKDMKDNKGRIVLYIITLPIIALWSLGYLYRWSIKSTAWLLFPLAFLAYTNSLRDNKSKL